MDVKPSKKTPARSVSKKAAVKPKPRPSVKPKPRGQRELILTDDITSSLRAIDQDSPTKQFAKSPKTRKRRSDRKPWSRKHKALTTTAIIVLIIALALGYVGLRLANSGGRMFEGNIFDAILSTEKLQQDDSGRTNILIFGTSEDDPGHSGALLADSIMLLSVDQETKAAYTTSIPRDLWVDYGAACPAGYQGKINAAYACAISQDNDESASSMYFAKNVGGVLGLDVQYYAKVNYSFVRDTVNSLGGVDVTIDSRDPRGIYDVVTGLELPNGTNSINGEQALDLTRARGSKGGYGLEQSNFDREKNQQAVLKAIQSKAASSGTLANPIKALNLVDALSANIKTNVKSSELRTVIDIAAGVQSDNIVSLPLNSKDNPLVTTGSYNGQSIVRPVKGLMDYSDIQEYILSQTQPNVSSN